MSKNPKSRVRNIQTVLRRHLGQRTVLGVAIPILAGTIDAVQRQIEFQGLTEAEIVSGFRTLAGKFIKSEYHPTYIQRRLGPSGFLEIVSEHYRFREALIADVDLKQLEQLHEELIASLRSAFEERQAVIKAIEDTCALPRECIEERRALVDSYLSQLTGNHGEMFEVVSFAVLREYFRSLGFSLQRFSTTYANDGGMDFIASEAIYQVTVDESVQKIRRDLDKAPGINRVLVRPTVTPEIQREFASSVLSTIELKDLLTHFIAWLLDRDTKSNDAKHLQHILQIALEEFRRENRAENA